MGLVEDMVDSDLDDLDFYILPAWLGSHIRFVLCARRVEMRLELTKWAKVASEILMTCLAEAMETEKSKVH